MNNITTELTTTTVVTIDLTGLGYNRDKIIVRRAGEGYEFAVLFYWREGRKKQRRYSRVQLYRTFEQAQVQAQKSRRRDTLWGGLTYIDDAVIFDLATGMEVVEPSGSSK